MAWTSCASGSKCWEVSPTCGRMKKDEATLTVYLI